MPAAFRHGIAGCLASSSSGKRPLDSEIFLMPRYTSQRLRRVGYFNLQYMAHYGTQVGWAHWTGLIFVNPASAAQDLVIANCILFPLWTISDAKRTGMRAGWLYFPMSVLTSYAFALGLYLALRERKLRQE